MFSFFNIRVKSNHCKISFTVFVFLLVFNFDSLSQTFVIDSLKSNEIYTLNTNKPELYYLMSSYYFGSNLDSAAYYGNKALQYSLSDDSKDDVVIIKQLILLSTIYNSLGDYQKSITMLENAEINCNTNNNYKLLVEVILARADIYASKAKYAEGIKSINNALDIININNLDHLKGLIYKRMSLFYMAINDYVFATYFLNMAINLSVNDSDKYNYVSCLLQQSELQFKQANYDSSYFYGRKALYLAKYNNLKQLIRVSYRRIAMSLIEKKDFDNALLTIDSSIVFCNEFNLIPEETSLITYKAHIYSLMGNFDKTLNLNLIALELREQSRNKKMISVSNINIGGNYVKLGKFDTAQYYIEKGLKIASELNHYQYLVYGYGKLVDLYLAKGNYEEAFVNTKLKNEYNSIILRSKTNDEIMFVKVQYELEKEKAISEELIREKNTFFIWFLAIVSCISIIVILFLIRAIIISNKYAKEIKKLSIVIETTSHGVYIAKYDGSVIYVNKSFLNLTGFSNKNDVLGKLMNDFTDTDGVLLLKNDVYPSLLVNEHWYGEMAAKKNDGTQFVSEQSISVIRSKENNVLFYIGIFSDITNRKRIENDLNTSNKKLEKEVATRDKMFSVIAHDLTGPFSAILGFSKLLASDFASYLPEDHKKFSRIIYESTKNTFDLLTNILNWSRSQLDSVELLVEEINLYELVIENTNPLKLMISKKEQLFINSIDSNTTIFADSNTIGIIIRNLVSNAIKFTPHGGTIEIFSKDENDRINITVSDNGTGISPDEIVNLFNDNSQMSKKGTDDESGTGLGLLLCNEFVKLNNGTLSVKSEVGIGSRFTISLPLKKLDNYSVR